MYVGVHKKYTLFLPDLKQLEFFSTDLRKYTSTSNFTKTRPVGAESFHADGQKWEANSRFDVCVTVHH